MCGPVLFKNGIFSVNAEKNLSEIHSLRGGKFRSKVLLIDSVSISDGSFNPDVIENIRIPGCDVWLAEAVRYLEDIVDAFLGGLEKLVFPICYLSKYVSLKEIYAASDSCVPMIIWSDGKVWGKGSILGQASDAASAGFRNALVADLDGTLDNETWNELRSVLPGLFAFCPKNESEADGKAPVHFKTMYGYGIS